MELRDFDFFGGPDEHPRVERLRQSREEALSDASSRPHCLRQPKPLVVHSVAGASPESNLQRSHRRPVGRVPCAPDRVRVVQKLDGRDDLAFLNFRLGFDAARHLNHRRAKRWDLGAGRYYLLPR